MSGLKSELTIHFKEQKWGTSVCDVGIKLLESEIVSSNSSHAIKFTFKLGKAWTPLNFLARGYIVLLQKLDLALQGLITRVGLSLNNNQIKSNQRLKRKRKENIWFNLSYNKNVKLFLKFVAKTLKNQMN